MPVAESARNDRIVGCCTGGAWIVKSADIRFTLFSAASPTVARTRHAGIGVAGVVQL